MKQQNKTENKHVKKDFRSESKFLMNSQSFSLYHSENFKKSNLNKLYNSHIIFDDDETDSVKIDQQRLNTIKIGDLMILKNLQLHIEKGQFVAIIGNIGSGKSSILSSIIGDMLFVNDAILNKYKNQKIYQTAGNEDSKTSQYIFKSNKKLTKKFTMKRKKQE